MTWPRLLFVPGVHHHVRRLHGPIVRLVCDSVGRPVLDPAWIADNAMSWDVVHMHLGLDADPMDLGRGAAEIALAPAVGGASPEAIVEAVEANRRAGVPVVMTVHTVATREDPLGVQVVDLLRRTSHAVAAVLTLTDGCATYLQEQIDRPVRAVPHGPIIDGASRSRLRAHRRRLAVQDLPLLLHAGSLGPDLLLEDLLEAVRVGKGRRPLDVLVREDRADAVRDAAAGMPQVRVRPHRSLEREDLALAMSGSSAVVLPHANGCHSTMLELAADVGVPVIATDVGWRCQQAPMIPVPLVEGRADIDALAAALDGPLPLGPTVSECERERAEHAFRSHHQHLYHRLLLGRVAEPELLLTGAAS